MAIRAQNIVAARVKSAAASTVEDSNAQVAAIQASLAEKRAETDQRAAWAALAVTWGGSPESAGRVLGNLLVVKEVPSFANLKNAAERNPDLIIFAAEQRLREAKVALARTQTNPDIDLSAGIRRFQSTRDQAFVVSATLPLGVAARAQPAIDAAQAQSSAITFDEQAHRQMFMGTLFGLREQAAHSALTLSELQLQALPLALRAQEQAEAAFRAGRASFLELAAAQRQLLDLRRAKIEVAVEYHKSIIDLERLIGVSASSVTTGAP